MKIRLAIVMMLTTGVFITSSFADSAKTTLTGPMAERFNAISDRLTCQCNCQMNLAVCNHQNCPSGIPMRQEIEAKLQQGLSDDAIVEGFVARIGKRVLSAPPAKGGYLLAWIMPSLVLSAGALGLIVWLLRRRRKQTEPSGASSAQISPQEEEKFTKEWKKWNQR